MASDPFRKIFEGRMNGTQVRFEEMKRLGNGQFGTVSLVKDLSNDKQYALKYITDKSRKREIEVETKNLEKINHPNIIKHIGSFTCDGYPCLITEYANGETLQQVIEKQKGKPLEITKIAKIFIQLIEALVHLHKNGLVHRDIKPENVIIQTDKKNPELRNEELQVKLIDFGLAAEIDPQTNYLEGRAGARHYAPPEAFEPGKSKNSFDIWCLGATIYELITFDKKHLKMPNGFSQYMETHPNILEENVPYYDMRKLLQVMLNLDKNKRISAEELLSTEIISCWENILKNNEPIKILGEPTTVLPLISLLDPFLFPIYVQLSLDSFDEMNLTNATSDVLTSLIKCEMIQKLCGLITFADTNSYSKGAIKLLNIFLEREETREIAANLIYGSNSLGTFVEKFRLMEVGMDNTFRYLVTVPFMERILCQSFGLEYLLIHLMKKDVTYAMTVYEMISSFSHDECLKLFLDEICDLEDVTSKLTALISHNNAADKLVTDKTKENWESCLCSLEGDLNNEFLSALVQLIFPMNKITNFISNQQTCNHKECGNIQLYQSIYLDRSFCATCYSHYKKTKTEGYSPLAQRFSSCKGDLSPKEKPSFIRKGDTPKAPQIIDQFTNKKIRTTFLKYVKGLHLFHFPHGIRIQINHPDPTISVQCVQNSFKIAEKATKNSNHSQMYFEVEITEMPKIFKGGNIAVGFTLRDTENSITQKGSSLLGGKEYEYAHHSFDGSFHNGKFKTQYGNSFGTGDVVGCGITGDRRIFYTLNGKFLGCITNGNQFLKVDDNVLVYPSIGVKGNTCSFNLYFSKFVYKPKKVFQGLSTNEKAVKLIFENMAFTQKLERAFSDETCHDALSVLVQALKKTDNLHFENVLQNYKNIKELPVPKFFKSLFEGHDVPSTFEKSPERSQYLDRVPPFMDLQFIDEPNRDPQEISSSAYVDEPIQNPQEISSGDYVDEPIQPSAALERMNFIIENETIVLDKRITLELHNCETNRREKYEDAKFKYSRVASRAAFFFNIDREIQLYYFKEIDGVDTKFYLTHELQSFINFIPHAETTILFVEFSKY